MAGREKTVRRIDKETHARLVRLQLERERLRIERLEKRMRSQRAHSGGPQQKVDAPRPHCVILERYATSARIRPARPRRQPHIIACPRVFSFIESPDDALTVLDAIVACGMHPNTRSVFFDQEACELMDLCANSVASALAIEAQRDYKLSFQGRFPDSLEQRDITEAAGLPKALGMTIGEHP